MSTDLRPHEPAPGRRRPPGKVIALGVGALLVAGPALAVVVTGGSNGDSTTRAGSTGGGSTGATRSAGPVSGAAGAGASTPGAGANSPAAGANSPAAIETGPTVGRGDRYRDAIDLAAARGLRIWLEVDLVKRWLAGRPRFDQGVQRVAALARSPGVVGIKVADELGYHDGTTSADQVLAFLRDTSTALRAAAPGKQILIDMVVPELGCLPGASPTPLAASTTAAQERDRYPQLALDQIDRYVRSGTFDVLDLSTGLRDDRTYAEWGTDRDAAQRASWAEARRRGWSESVTLQARKALAQADGWSGSTGQAQADLRTWVDIPLQDGAGAVDVWTWAQHYQGRTFALLSAGGTGNPLWDGLVRRRTAGRRLFTHFTPSVTRQDVTTDLTELATGFTDVFMATGTG